MAIEKENSLVGTKKYLTIIFLMIQTYKPRSVNTLDGGLIKVKGRPDFFLGWGMVRVSCVSLKILICKQNLHKNY